MTTSELRQRVPLNPVPDAATSTTDPYPPKKNEALSHPSGRIKYGRVMAFLRALSVGIYFLTGCIVINATQIIGSPLYFINKEHYYAYMSLCKASFGLLTTTMTNWWAPTVIRMSGDESVADQLKPTADGRVECDFPERLVLIANHQIYTDWLYLWWVGYTNVRQMHGHIYIILKESIKYIPIIGLGCIFHGFIFMSRKMSIDQPRLAYRLGKLKTKYTTLDGHSYLNPMWLLLFPEGTNLSGNGRKKSAAWAEKTGIQDLRHLMLPRSTGMYFCLNELKGTVDYVYDCTVAYEGVPRGDYGEQYFSLSSTFFQGRPPKSVNFYWRRFAVADIPLDSAEAFDLWLRERWVEKDALLEQYICTGRFPASPNPNPNNNNAPSSSSGTVAKGHIESEVRTKHWWEFLKIFTMLGAFVLTFNVILKTFRRLAQRA